MMRSSRASLVPGLVLAVLALLAPASAGEGVTRIHLLAEEDGGLRWSTTAQDREAALASMTQTCGVRQPTPVTDRGTCRSYFDPMTGEHLHAFDFYPGALIDEAPQATGPLRFRFEVDVATALPYTVHAVVTDESWQEESAAATEVEPGVFEGELRLPRPFGGQVTLVSVAVRTTDPRTTVRVATAGASWLELPHRLGARSVPELLAADTYAPAPGVYRGGTRTVWLNDAAWSAWSFTGDLTAARTFDVPLPAAARMLVAWVDTFDTPPVYDLLRGREVDARELENSPHLRLLRGSTEVAFGSNSGIRGNGQDDLAAVNVPAGPVRVEVTPSSWDPDGGGQELDYTVHVLALHGPRTLARMRWSLAGPNDFGASVVRACAYGYSQVPVTTDVTTLLVHLDTDSSALGAPDWTIRYDLLPLGELPCGETGDALRLTVPPGNEVRYFGPVPEAHSLHTSNFDTVFELDVTYTYSAP